ncbi:unnamed protein product [Closterium sp. NIES-54]
MTVKEALASWKGKVVKATMDEDIQSLITNGTWEFVERPRGVNVMKNCWVYGADYDETYATVRSYVMLWIFFSIVAILDLHLMHPLLWYSTLDVVVTGAGRSKSQVNEALYFRVGEDGVACWVLVYVDDLLAASNSTAMLKELLEATFELCEISPVENYLGLEIVRDRPARKLWLHQQSYVGMLRRRFINEEQTGRRPKTPVSVDAYAEPTFDDEDFQSREEEEYRQKLLDVGTPTILNMDNQSAITAAEGLGLKGNLKHMEQRYAWLQQMVKRKKIALEYIPTSEQPADFLTKALHFPAFNRCSVAVGQVRLANIGDDDDVQQ